MDFFDYFHQKLEKIIQKIYQDNSTEYENKKFVVENPRIETDGDLSTNIAMVHCKVLNIKPLDMAEKVLEYLKEDSIIQHAEAVKPGFINFKVNNEFWTEQIENFLIDTDNFTYNNTGNGKKVNIEFVSANPTGPMHIGHARGAVMGDILANLYKFMGYNVHKEYYLNDAGGQIKVLANSLYVRYLEQFDITNHDIDTSEMYPGEYVIDCAKELIKEDGDKWTKTSYEEAYERIKSFALSYMITLIKEDLSNFGVKHDVFISEAEVSTNESYKNAVQSLTESNLVYKGKLEAPKGKKIEGFEPREQLLFKSTLYGDDSDRALEKSNGERTYFANDMVYHYNKVERGYEKLVDILGADHIGYAKRIQAAVLGLSKEKTSLDVVFCQMVNILENGQIIKMSKRAGNFLTLKEVIELIGKDILRFIMITRRNDVHLDVDIATIKEQSMDNPIFYIQYAYVRAQSVLRKYEEELGEKIDLSSIKGQMSDLQTEHEIALIKSILSINKALKGALETNNPHRVYLYLMEISKRMHTLWGKGQEDKNQRFIIENNKKLTISRILLLVALSKSMEKIFSILGVTLLERM